VHIDRLLPVRNTAASRRNLPLRIPLIKLGDIGKLLFSWIIITDVRQVWLVIQGSQVI
jgi:hypothetical protein